MSQAASTGPRAVHRAWVRQYNGGRDHRAGRCHGAHLLPALRRQTRGAVRRRGWTAGPAGGHGGERASLPGPLDAVAAGLEAAGALFQEYRPTVQQRAAIIAATPELRERELIKLTVLSAALADTLRGRGLGDPAARLTAEVAIAVFRIAFERWIGHTNERPFSSLVRESLDHLKSVTAGA